MHHTELETPLARLGPQDFLTVKDLASHVIGFGASGSGKTTGAAELLAGSCLRSGMGMLVCCLKPDEGDLWVKRCQAYGRETSLIRWSGKNFRFNFIAHCLARFGVDGLNSVIEYLLTILEIVKQAGPSPGRASEQFWTDSIRAMLRHTVPLLYAATGTVCIGDVLRFVQSAPQSRDQMRDPDWQNSAYFAQVCLASDGQIDADVGLRCAQYWRDSIASLDAKTRGNILISLTTALDRFNHGWLRDTFCTDSTITPELCFHGAVIVMDMPPTTLGEDGLVAQLLFKHCWQQAMLARNALAVEQRSRYCALFADEYQAFAQRGDADFLATCRSSRVCFIALTQSLPSLYAKIGGENPQHAAHHLLGNFSTKVWHANSCAETNEWAANTIGRTLQERAGYSRSQGTSEQYGMNLGEGTNWGNNGGSGWSSSIGPDGKYNSSRSSNVGSSRGGNDSWGRNRGGGSNEGESWSSNDQMDYLIEPGEFARMLKTGGPANGSRVSAVWYEAGRVFNASRGNALLVEFQQ